MIPNKDYQSPIWDTAVIVSGFARTGTSTMMRMLNLAGIDVMASEGNIAPDEAGRYNPYGDYEMENLADLRNDPELGRMVIGRAVKIVSPYIGRYAFLPDVDYRCIFMLRDRTEIISSLMAMRTVWEYDIDEAIQDSRLVLQIQDVPILDVHYRDMIHYPKTTALRIAEFLDADLDIDKMATAVDKQARRLKNKEDRPGGGLITFEPTDYDEQIQMGNVRDDDGDEVVLVKDEETGEYIPRKVVEKIKE